MIDKQLAKNIEKWEKLSDKGKIQKSFINYLQEYDQSKEIIRIAKKIDWGKILAIYNQELLLLFGKLSIPKNYNEIKNILTGFRYSVLSSIMFQMFHFVFILIKENSQQWKKQSKVKINREILRVLDVAISQMFSVFDFQYSLTSLNKNNDPKVLVTKLEELKNSAERGRMFLGKKNRPIEIKVFEEIIKRHKELLKEGIKPSYRTLAYNYAYKDLGLIHDKEKENFYKRFMRFNNKS